MKATAISHPDIALIKYWGKKIGAKDIRLPANGSISMVLSELKTTTTVEFSEAYTEDIVKIGGELVTSIQKNRVIEHVDRIRTLASLSMKVRIQSEFNFPMGAGISSSASGFSALTCAGAAAAGLDLSQKQLSILARKASGSACRPIADGFVEWLDGDSDETSFAQSIFPKDHWDICDVVVIISYEKKDIPTTDGMVAAETSPFFKERLSRMPAKLESMKKHIADRDFQAFGELIESEALEMHSIALTQKTPILYWLPETIVIMKAVQQWRKEGLPVYFTINTGQNVHIIVEKKNVSLLEEKLKGVPEVEEIFVNEPSDGTRLVDEHLF